MRRIFSRYTLNVFQLKLEEWPYGEHTHNFYEIILINSGTGRHILNDVSFRYAPGHIFLLTPEDYHFFEIGTYTVFTYIKFTEQIFVERQLGGNIQPRQGQFETLLHNLNTVPESIIKDKEEQKLIFPLADILLNEFNHPKLHSRILMLEVFGAMMTIIARNISGKNIGTGKVASLEKEKVLQVLSHIRQNMDKKELLSQKHIAEVFNIAPGYVSSYLKKHTGTGLKKMITETRLKTAERLLKQSTYTVSQIADRVGFSDASHMNKMFQKYRGMNPTELR